MSILKYELLDQTDLEKLYSEFQIDQIFNGEKPVINPFTPTGKFLTTVFDKF